MSDLPFFSGGGSGSGGGGGGVTSYDALTNKPVINLSGSPVIISTLDTGVYNIDGTWAMTSDDPARETLKDDLFYVSNKNGKCKLTRICAGEIQTFTVPNSGGATDIEVSTVATTDDIIGQLVGDF